jgi:DNA-binding NarL/FixJ family response regulator
MPRNKTTVTVPATAKILVVDDHPMVREGLSNCLGGQADLRVCGAAADVREALRKIDSTQPDLVIIDISLKDGNGIDLIKQIRTRNSRIKMLVYSMFDESAYAERAVRAGALGYVNKQEPPEKLLEGIRQVLNGRIYVSDATLDRFMRRVIAGNEMLPPIAAEALSNRELEIFRLLGSGLTTRRVAEKLHVSVRTVEAHRENIKQKLNIRDAAELMRHAVEWVLENQ